MARTVLFSDDRIAQFINQAFEPSWESVRPVPLVTIDFGEDHVLTRTLNGNIATYVCRSDRQMLDVLPGIYEPETYYQQLVQFMNLAKWVQQSDDVTAAIAAYHKRQADQLEKGQQPLVVAFDPTIPISKAAIEVPLKLTLVPDRRALEEPVASETDRANDTDTVRFETREQLARWRLLAEDTRINERLRRTAIHGYLAQQQAVTPQDVTKWLYREVLHADLDDPYLGLGKTLFASYPFNDQ